MKFTVQSVDRATVAAPTLASTKWRRRSVEWSRKFQFWTQRFCANGIEREREKERRRDRETERQRDREEELKLRFGGCEVGFIVWGF